MDNKLKEIHPFIFARWDSRVRSIFVWFVIISLVIPVAGFFATQAGASTNPMYASFDGNVIIDGVTYADDDILRFNGTTWSFHFDGSDVGLSGVDTTAFEPVNDNTALLVFDSSVTLGGVTYEPTDIVQFNATQFGSATSGTFSLYFNGVDVGLDNLTSERIDALSVLDDGRILISTNGNPLVPDVDSAQDEDILAFTPATLGADTSGTWEMYFDGSDVGLSDTGDEDVDSLDVVEGTIYLSTFGAFSVSGVSGTGSDIFVCYPTSLGDNTSCIYDPALYFDSSAFATEFGTSLLDGFGYYAVGPVPTATSMATATLPPGATTNPMYASFGVSGTVGGVDYADEDIVRFNGATWSMFFDGSDVGLSAVDTMAFELLDDNTALLVFESAITLGGVTYEPTDIVQFNATRFGSVTSGTFSLYFNGVDVGLDNLTSERIDALSVLDDGRILISTNGNPSVNDGVSGFDEDILAFTPAMLGADTSGAWEMYFDGSDVGLDDTDEDIDAVDVFDGKVYLSAIGAYSVSGVSGVPGDVFVCSPTSLGNTTACDFAPDLYFDGWGWGQGAVNLDAFVYLDLEVPPTPTATSTPTMTSTPTQTSTPIPPTVISFKSAGVLDGWVRETNETSNQGGTINAGAATFNLGDTATRQQYRTVLSFNTSSLPDNAKVTRVVLKIKKQGVTGTNPFTTHRKIAIDIRKFPFSNNAALQSADFQAVASKLGVGFIANNPTAGGWYLVRLSTIASDYINLKGNTQFRLRFQTDDDNDAVADFISFYSGNSILANRPILVIEYTLQ